MSEWKDASSYSRGDKERMPSAWRLSAGGLHIMVHRHIYHPPDVWVFSCQPWFDARALASRDADAAKAEALEQVRARLAEAAAALLPEHAKEPTP